MNESELEQVKKKMTEIDRKIDMVSFLCFSYVHALLAILKQKEVVPEEEFSAYLEQTKKDLQSLSQQSEFLKMMKDFKPPKKE